MMKVNHHKDNFKELISFLKKKSVFSEISKTIQNEILEPVSFKINGLQTKIKSVAPQALFTHCYVQVFE
jgi:hypothetical protein